MPTVTHFVKRKSQQLAFYVRGFLQKKIAYSELDLFFWDTMEEWAQVKSGKQQPYERTEQVFWHVLHQVHYWPKNTLQEDLVLREELEICLNFLEGEEQYPLPLDCIGIRP
ncbi:hypothetical protein [Paraglaciecola sp.]|uniref:hypothetical protein n=1 Tax=Paraglaciecola sp. TaxID=1920173 RepID=UPI003EFA2B2A